MVLVVLAIAASGGVVSAGPVTWSAACAAISGCLTGKASTRFPERDCRSAADRDGHIYSANASESRYGFKSSASASLEHGLEASITAPRIGWAILGSEVHAHSTDINYKVNVNVTYDCWKPIIHDTSLEPSKGRTLNDILGNKMVKSFSVINQDDMMFEIENVFQEKFLISPVILPSKVVAFHATKVN